MLRRQPVPRLWLMTDERQGETLWPALERLPRGSGVVFRHYGLPVAERRALFARIAKVAARRGLILVAGGEHRMRGVAGRHGQGRGTGLRTAPAHSRREAIAAARSGVDAVFVSPVFPTRSHPGAPALGRVRFGLLIAGIDIPVIALGGMDSRRARSLQPIRIHGWAGIDAWSRTTAVR